MLNEQTAMVKRTIMAYGCVLLDPKNQVHRFTKDSVTGELPLIGGFKYERATVSGAFTFIEELGTYTTIVSMGLSVDDHSNDGAPTQGLGVWQRTAKGWRLLNSHKKLSKELQGDIQGILTEALNRIYTAVRVAVERNREQTRLVKLANVLKLTNVRWGLDAEQKDILLTYEYDDRPFNPYHEEFWIWEMVRRCKLAVEHNGREQIFTHPRTKSTLSTTSNTHRPLRALMADWLLEQAEK